MTGQRQLQTTGKYRTTLGSDYWFRAVFYRVQHIGQVRLHQWLVELFEIGPCHNVVPWQVSIMACTPGSDCACTKQFDSCCRTPCDNAFTGGLLMAITAMPSSVLRLARDSIKVIRVTGRKWGS